jgi:hypothetical protein
VIKDENANHVVNSINKNKGRNTDEEGKTRNNLGEDIRSSFFPGLNSFELLLLFFKDKVSLCIPGWT